MNRSRQFGRHVQRLTPCSARVGFTLVEMLVAVTLVLLMMVMFGEMFQIATGSVTKQRIMADNDQNVRTFISVIRADLDKRTFRTLIPYFPGELSSNPGTPFEKRRGYFYISNNNLADGTDDVLQLTVDSTVNLGNADDSPYYGHAIPLTGVSAAAFLTNPNQPDRDDNQIISNNAGSSKAGEISYFLRGGKLYRRVMLIREPVKGAGVSTDVSQAAQPANAAGVDYFAGTYPAGNNFWNDFDYSAHRMPGSLAFLLSLPLASTNARFNGLDYLSNDSVLRYPLPQTPPFSFPPNKFHPFAYSLGQTWNRFGHNSEISGPAPLNIPAIPSIQNGLPREFSAATAPNFFIGRFTQEETSNGAFEYPQEMPAGGNPMDAVATTLADTNNDSVVDSLTLGPRIGVDLLLANVHEFRVEIWDQRIGQFAPIGHGIGAGDYNLGRQLNPTYMPLGGSANIFDTWHPKFDRNFNNPNSGAPPYDTADWPPFRALTWNPAAAVGDPAAPPGPTPSAPFVRGFWAPNTTYNVGDVVFPRTEDLNGNGVLDAGENSTCGFAPPFGDVAGTVPNTPDDSAKLIAMIPDGYPQQFRPFGLTYAYRCVQQGHSLGTGPAGAAAFEPDWHTNTIKNVIGFNEDLNNNGAFNPGETDWDGDGVPESVPVWLPVYNVRPVRAIRITVRFEHPQSKQMRQITIVHSLRDTTSVP